MRTQRFLIYVFLVLVLVGLAGQALALYLMPAGYTSIFKADYAGMHLFKVAFGLGGLAPVSSTTFVLLYRSFTLLTYTSYIGLLLAAYSAGAIDLRRGLVVAGVVASTVAVLYPPGMSSDVFSYLAYAHMGRYHLNPYFTPPGALVPLHDAVTNYLPHLDPKNPALGLKWDIPTVYGPVWTMMSTALSMLGGSSLIAQAILFKLLEAAGLIVAALAAYWIAQSKAPGRAPVVFLAVAFNPLLLSEGPGNGHNDMLMMGLIVLAGAYLARRLPTRAALALGLAVGVKVIPLLVLPWMLCEYRDRLGSMRKIVKFALAFLAPLVLGFVPYWAGPSTLRAILLRGTARPSGGAGLSSSIAGAHTSTLSTMIHDNAAILIGYAALSIWVVLSTMRKNSEPSPSQFSCGTVSWAVAWSIESVLVVYFLLKMLFPWYAIWLWTASAVSWNRVHLNMLLISLSISLMTTWLYTLSNQLIASNLIYTTLLASTLAILGINYFSYVTKINKKSYSVELCLFRKSAV